MGRSKMTEPAGLREMRWTQAARAEGGLASALRQAAGPTGLAGGQFSILPGVWMSVRRAGDPPRYIGILILVLLGLACLFVPVRIQVKHDAGAQLVMKLFGPKAAWLYGSVFYRVLGAVFLGVAVYLLIEY